MTLQQDSSESGAAGERQEVPDAAVEAAAKAYYTHLGWDWENLDVEARDHDENLATILREFRIALVAAKPYLVHQPVALMDDVAEVLREAAGNRQPGFNPYRHQAYALAAAGVFREPPTHAELTEWLREIFTADPGGTSWDTGAECLLALLDGSSK